MFLDWRLPFVATILFAALCAPGEMLGQRDIQPVPLLVSHSI